MIVMALAVQGAVRAQAAGALQAQQDYEATVTQADALVAAGNAFEAVRLYERAGRLAYNNKLATDSAALNAKLAAARSARDSAANAAKSAPLTPALPASPAAATGASAPATGAVADPGAADADAWIRYGDALVAAGEAGDAVRAYERARRVATASGAGYDRAALDARIAAAAQGRDARHASADLIPAPLPALPAEPGAAAGPVFLKDRPGQAIPWSLHAESAQGEVHATDAELKAFDANLHRVMEVLGRAPVLSPPLGFELDVRATLGSVEDVKERQRYLAAHLPLRAAIRFSGAAYFEVQQRSKSSGARSSGVGTIEETFCRNEITVNVLPRFAGLNATGLYADGELEYFLEPQKDGELAGVPVYGDTLVIARPGVALWKPVSMGQALQALLPAYKSAADTATAGIEGTQKAYADFMSPAAADKRRQEVAAQRDAGAEANAHKLEIMQRRWEEDARKAAETAANDPKHREPVDAYKNAQSRLASLDAAGQAAPACIIVGPGRSPDSDWRVVPLGTPNCRALVTRNPELLDGKRPRSELQVLYLSELTKVNRWLDDKKFLRNQPGDCVAMAKILRQADWKQLGSLLAH